jgi:hypothetical protein
MNLGYIVQTSTNRENGVLAFSLLIQGSRHPKHTEAMVETFLHEMRVRITISLQIIRNSP